MFRDFGSGERDRNKLLRGKRRRGRELPTKECICPECKTVITHRQGIPCFQVNCPKCNSPMMGRFYSIENPDIR